METFIEFLVNNYLWIFIITLIIIFALIGYLVDTNTAKQKKKIKPIANIETKNGIHPSVEPYTSDRFDDPLINDVNNR